MSSTVFVKFITTFQSFFYVDFTKLILSFPWKLMFVDITIYILVFWTHNTSVNINIQYLGCYMTSKTKECKRGNCFVHIKYRASFALENLPWIGYNWLCAKLSKRTKNPYIIRWNLFGLCVFKTRTKFEIKNLIQTSSYFQVAALLIQFKTLS